EARQGTTADLAGAVQVERLVPGDRGQPRVDAGLPGPVAVEPGERGAEGLGQGVLGGAGVAEQGVQHALEEALGVRVVQLAERLPIAALGPRDALALPVSYRRLVD